MRLTTTITVSPSRRRSMGRCFVFDIMFPLLGLIIITVVVVLVRRRSFHHCNVRGRYVGAKRVGVKLAEELMAPHSSKLTAR